MYNFTISIILCIVIASISSRCEQTQKEKIRVKAKRVWKKPVRTSYHLENALSWLQRNSDKTQRSIVLAVNRTDSSHLAKMDSILVPDDLSGDLATYLPFPASVPGLDKVEKIIFFSYPSQTFAAYAYGELFYAGPTNMGRKADPTPVGLYFTNSKAEKTTSTFNDEWDLYWNFNIENKKGIGFHQYELPGYPASHSCLRLLETDAKFLYNWAEQWILKEDETILAKGTPVIVFGSYPFDGAKPWVQLLSNPHALNITATSLQQTATPYLKTILKEQQTRAAVATNE